MSIIIEYQGDLFSIVVDKIGEVVEFQKDNFNRSPANLDECWRNLSSGVYNHNKTLFVTLNEEKICNL